MYIQHAHVGCSLVSVYDSGSILCIPGSLLLSTSVDVPSPVSVWFACRYSLLVSCLMHLASLLVRVSMRGFEKLESLLMQTADSCFGLFGPRQCSCSTWSLPATPS